jgi:hypothetical protein
MEASALRATDKVSKIRMVAALHADDPALFDSSRGGLQQAIDAAAQWAFRWKAAFHTGTAKNVVQVAGQGAGIALASGSGLAMSVVGGPRFAMTQKIVHKWLGLLWRMDLDFSAAPVGKISHADSLVASLSGLVSSGSLPLAFAARIFEGKVDGFLRYGRWLVVLVWNAVELLDDAYHRWARAVLGSPRWRSGDIAAAELGWKLSGFARAVLDVASRRSRLWQLAEGDLYGDVFRASHYVSAVSWAYRSRELLCKWGLPDWPQFGGPVFLYLRVVRKMLEKRCELSVSERASNHMLPVPYSSYSSGAAPDLDAVLCVEGLGCASLVGQQSVSRMRANPLELGHRRGHRTRAATQTCIACSASVTNAGVHCLTDCPVFLQWRASLVGFLSGPLWTRSDLARTLLGLRPGHPAYIHIVRLVAAIEKNERKFWSAQ